MTNSALLNSLLALGVDFILWLQSYQSPTLTTIFHYFTWAADFRIFLFIIPLIWWSRGAAAGLQLSATAIVSSVLNTLIKDAVALPRPFQVFPDVQQLSEATGFSFPSGHAQFGAAIWTSLFLLFPKPWFFLVCSTMIVGSGLSRSYFGVHYPTDILAGWALGLSVAYELTKITLARAAEARIAPALRFVLAALGAIFVFSIPHPYIATSIGAAVGIILGAQAWNFIGYGKQLPRICLGALGLLLLIGANLLVSPWVLAATEATKLPIAYLFLTYAIYGYWVCTFPFWLERWATPAPGK